MYNPRRTSRLFEKLGATTKRISAKPTAEEAHQLRTTIRRVETLVAARKADDLRVTSKLLRQLARLRRRAGKVRDIDVQIDALRSVTLDGVRRETAKLARHLDKLRSKRERKLVATVEEERSNGLVRRLNRAITLLGSGEYAINTRENFTRTAVRNFDALVRRYPHLHEANLHEFRLRCKRIRYLAELGVNTSRSQPVIAELKRIQDSVGHWHDWVALTETAEEVLNDARSPLLSALRTQRRAKFIGALRTIQEAKQKLLELASSLDVPKKSPRPSHSASAMDTLPMSNAAGAA